MTAQAGHKADDLCFDILRLKGRIAKDALADRITLRAQNAALTAVCQHIAAMADDAYLSGHPEFCAIADEAKAALAGKGA